MFEELVSKLLYSWQDADFRQVEKWANGEVWQELQDIAKYQAAQQLLAPDAGDSAASSGIVNASTESTSQAESAPTKRW